MAYHAHARVWETPVTVTGTGNVTLPGSAATGGYRTFDATFASGDTCPYVIRDTITGAWEAGTGTITIATGVATLARTTVLESTNANALVSFAGNACDVQVDYPPGGPDLSLLAQINTVGAGLTLTSGTLTNTGSVLQGYTASATGLVIPAGATAAVVKLWGAGGGGGGGVGNGTNATAISAPGYGGGGGGGGYSRTDILIGTASGRIPASATFSVVVPAGGAGGAGGYGVLGGNGGAPSGPTTMTVSNGVSLMAGFGGGGSGSAFSGDGGAGGGGGDSGSNGGSSTVAGTAGTGGVFGGVAGNYPSAGVSNATAWGAGGGGGGNHLSGQPSDTSGGGAAGGGGGAAGGDGNHGARGGRVLPSPAYAIAGTGSGPTTNGSPGGAGIVLAGRAGGGGAGGGSSGNYGTGLIGGAGGAGGFPGGGGGGGGSAGQKANDKSRGGAGGAGGNGYILIEWKS